MSITADQRKALTDAGYTVKGNSVFNKSGQSIGGYNSNGKIWSGSQKVTSILKSQAAAPKEAPKPAPKATPKPVAKAAPKAPKKAAPITASKLPPAKRPTKDISGIALGAIAKAEAKGVGKPSGKTVSYDQWKGMNMGQRVKAGLPTSVIGGELGFKRLRTGITGKQYTMERK